MADILIVDFFDSFTHNIFHALQPLTSGRVDVLRYNELQKDSHLAYSHLVLSPGPGLPKDYPNAFHLLRDHSEFKSVLGICLGMQMMIEQHGGKLKKLDAVKHGVTSNLQMGENSILFKGVSAPFSAGHYHSWVVSDDSFPTTFNITSRDNQGNIMSVENTESSHFGVQFHPESIMTSQGNKLLENWINQTRLS